VTSSDVAAWDRLLLSLLPTVADPTPAELRSALMRAARALKADDPELVPPSVRRAGSFAVSEHVEREATRAVIRTAYTLGDAGLASTGPSDLHPEHELEEVHPRLFAGPLLTLDWCGRLVAEFARLRAWSAAHGIPPVAPNSMSRYGLILDDLGLGAAVRWLTREVLRPLAASRYADLGGADLEDPHAFLVEYGDDADQELGLHVDDSEVTLNLCLGETFEGGELYFEGLRCESHRQTPCSTADTFLYQHAPGRALLHAGKHRHGAHPIRRGRRVNLIVWCRSPATRAAASPGSCPEWCRESRAL
jgi:hypothetical protein